MQEVLLAETLGPAFLPIYDKGPGPAYVMDGPSFTCQFRQDKAPPPTQETVVEAGFPHRVHVPLSLVVELKRAPSDLVFDLIRHVGELGNWVKYEGNFDNIQAYFASLELPLSVVVRSSALGFDVPLGVKVIEYAGAPRDRFYCLTAAESLGRMPIRHQGSEVGFNGTDEHGLIINPISIEERGFLIFNPRGILTAFV